MLTKEKARNILSQMRVISLAEINHVESAEVFTTAFEKSWIFRTNQLGNKKTILRWKGLYSFEITFKDDYHEVIAQNIYIRLLSYQMFYEIRRRWDADHMIMRFDCFFETRRYEDDDE